jgi:hypothetical protein
LTALQRRGIRGIRLEPRKLRSPAGRFIFRSAEPVTIAPRWAV